MIDQVSQLVLRLRDVLWYAESTHHERGRRSFTSANPPSKEEAMSTVTQIMTKRPKSVGPKSSVAAAAKAMRQARVGSLLVKSTKITPLLLLR